MPLAGMHSHFWAGPRVRVSGPGAPFRWPKRRLFPFDPPPARPLARGTPRSLAAEVEAHELPPWEE